MGIFKNDKKVKIVKGNDEDGFVLLVTLLIMILLTSMLMFASSNTVTEIKIAGNERSAARKFYIGDSGWKQALPWLDAMTTPPNPVNTITGSPTWLVRNYGGGAKDTLNNTFPVAAIDGLIGVPAPAATRKINGVDIPANNINSFNNIRYWYNVEFMGTSPEIGSGPNVRRFGFRVNSVAKDKDIAGNPNAYALQIVTNLSRAFMVGVN